MRKLLPKVRRFLSIPRGLAEVRAGCQPFVHSPQFLALPVSLMLPAICGPVRGALTCPANVTIVLVHNYPGTPLTEQSLRYVGIDDYVVVRMPTNRRFRNTDKLRAIIRWLDSGACRTEYMLYLDAADVFVRSDAAIAVDLLRHLRCDALFSSEQGPHVYECMPEVKAWTDGVAEAMRVPRRYLNAGVFVGRTAFLPDEERHDADGLQAGACSGSGQSSRSERARHDDDGPAKLRVPMSAVSSVSAARASRSVPRSGVAFLHQSLSCGVRAAGSRKRR